jgi:hypothetical protein
MKKAWLLASILLGLAAGARAQTPSPTTAPSSNLTLAESAAIKIKAEEANAKNRRAAVHYLGTLEWHYYPEAEEALVAALRADRNEQVRLEAAHALGLHMCTPHGMEALGIVVSGSEIDGNPAEISDKVKAAAKAALLHSQGKGDAPPEVAAKRPGAGKLPPPVPTPLQLTGYNEERAFAESIGAPKAPQNQPDVSRSPTRPTTTSRGVSGLTPIGFIPPQ